MLSCCSAPKQLLLHPPWRDSARLAQGTGGLLGARGSPAAWPDTARKPPWKARTKERSGKAPPRLLHHLTAACGAAGSWLWAQSCAYLCEQQGPSCPRNCCAPHLPSNSSGNLCLRHTVLQDRDAVLMLPPHFFLLCSTACPLPTTWAHRLNKVRPGAKQPLKVRGGCL